jgi:hypothetical protein
MNRYPSAMVDVCAREVKRVAGRSCAMTWTGIPHLASRGASRKQHCQHAGDVDPPAGHDRRHGPFTLMPVVIPDMVSAL